LEDLLRPGATYSAKTLASRQKVVFVSNREKAQWTNQTSPWPTQCVYCPILLETVHNFQPLQYRNIYEVHKCTQLPRNTN